MPIALPFALLLAAGAALGVHLDVALAPMAAYGAAVSLAGAHLARLHRLRGLPQLMLALAVMSGATLHGMHAVDRAEHTPLKRWLTGRLGDSGDDERMRMEEPVRVRGRLTRDAVPSEAGALVHLAVSRVSAGDAWEAASGGVAITVGGTLAGDAMHEWRGGRVLEMPVVLRRAARYLNDGVPDGERALARRGTSLVGGVKSAALVEVVDDGWWWDERAADVRAAVRAAMGRWVAPHDAMSGAIGTAILIGDRAAMSPEIERRLQEAGTYHVVAISGGNIALLAAALLAILWAAGVRFGGAALLTVIVLAAHAWVIGGGASVVRATVMAAIYLALRFIDQRTAPVHAVAVGAAVMLLVNPLEITNAGFWLTFGATGALLAAGARWQPPRMPRWWHAPLAIVVGSVAVELALTPVSAFVFQRVTLAGLVLNLAAIPAMALVQAAGTTCVLFDAAGLNAVAALTGWAAYLGAQGLLESGRLVEMAPWAAWRVPSPSLWLVVVYYAVLAAWWSASAPPVDRVWRRLAARGCGVTALAMWSWIALAPHTHARAAIDTRLRLTVMDVGQGEALLATFPNGRTLLVDAGGVSSRGEFDIGDRVLGPALRQRGLGGLDYLAITHGDPDHIGGALALVRDFRPREVWAGVPVARHVPQEALQGAARSAQSAWRWLQRGDRMDVGGVELLVHHPSQPDWERQQVRNDDSLVMALHYGEVSILLTGDISRAVEHDLAPLLETRRIVVLKAPHHGSATSSSAALVSTLRPAAVLVSAGRGNLYGHPAPVVLGRYAEAGAEVFRTDRDGQIELATDGQTVSIATFTGRRWRIR